MMDKGPIEHTIVDGKLFWMADATGELGPVTSGPLAVPFTPTPLSVSFTPTPLSVSFTPTPRIKLSLFEFICLKLITAPISIPLTIAVFLNMIFRGPIKGFIVLAEKIADFIVKLIGRHHE